MKTKLTANRARELFTYDKETGFLIRKIKAGSANAGDISGCPDTCGRLQTRVDGHRYRTHRLIWLIVTGNFPEYEIDHINRIPTDNRWSNLREATRFGNTQNVGVRRDNTSGFKGVTFENGKWKARCRAYGVKYSLGCYSTPEEASAKYEEFAQSKFGDFYNKNARLP